MAAHMRDPSPRAPFDQGLFLAHFNKGKELYDERRFEEAERELEEAYLLRPRDQKVLNLLGLVYFKQEKLEKAEEVYRKLAAESPEAHTLYYNLGLIYFKLNRLEEAESAFLKALELSGDNPKINFYLGSIYERLHRFQDAIYQYRQAGANLMVRRVEDKLAAGGARPRRKPARPLATRKDDTAEFTRRVPGQRRPVAREPARRPSATPTRLAPSQDPAAGQRRACWPRARPKALRTDTARFRIREAAGRHAPRAVARTRFPEVITLPARSTAVPARRTPASPPRRATESSASSRTT